MSRPSDCWIHQNFILKIHKPGDAEKACNPRSLDTRDKPLDSLQTSTRYIPVPALVFAALRPSECLRVTAEKRGQLCLNGSQDPRRDKPYTGNIFGVCVCVWSQVCSSTLFRLLLPRRLALMGGRKGAVVWRATRGGPRRQTLAVCVVQQAAWRRPVTSISCYHGDLFLLPPLHRHCSEWGGHGRGMQTAKAAAVSPLAQFSVAFLFFSLIAH